MKKKFSKQWVYTWIMRGIVLQLFLVFSIVSFAGVSATSGQGILQKRISLQVDNMKIKNVLKIIEQHATIRFGYQPQLVDSSRKVTLMVEDTPVISVLNMLFDSSIIFNEVGGMVIFKPAKIDAATLATISGKVTDAETGESLPGVNVVVKGTTFGTSTDIDGKYTLQVDNAEVVLGFSFVGYEAQEIPVNSQSIINVQLAPERKQLQEVVVIGFGQVQRKNLTGSVSSIGAKSLSGRSISTLAEGLSGQVAGVQVMQNSGVPGQEFAIKIRGTNSVNAGVTPLYVVDGIPMDDINGLNPTDVETIDILKDASSTSIYGARGANGVVVITLKKGRKGKASVTVNLYTGFQKTDRITPTMNKDEYLTYNIWRRNSDWLNNTYVDPATGQKLPADMNVPMSYRPAGQQLPAQWLAWQKGTDNLPDNNWQKLIYREAPVSSAQLGIAGGNDVGTYALSAGYLTQDGIVRGSDYKRFNFRLNSMFNVAKWMKIGLTIIPNISFRNDPWTAGKEGVVSQAQIAPPILGIYENSKAYGYPMTSIYGNTNVLVRLEEIKRLYKQVNLINDAFVEIHPLPDISLKSQITYTYRNDGREEFTPANAVGPTGGAYGYSTLSNIFNLTWQNTINYRKTYHKMHTIDVLLGQSLTDWRGNNLTIENAQNYSSDALGLGSTNLAATTTGTSRLLDQSRMFSLFGRVDYTLMDRYMFTAAVRRDGSSKFGPQNRYGVFPSLSAGWIINEENFLKDVNWLSFLKVRGAWGAAGNDRIGAFNYLSTLQKWIYPLSGTEVNAWGPGNYSNPSLGWETTISTDIGLDVSVLKDRISLTADVYRNRTKDMLYGVAITSMTGFTGTTQNIGEIENRGLEIQVSSTNIIKKDFKWSSTINFSLNRNKVLKLNGDGKPKLDNAWSQPTYITQVGQPIGSFWMYKSNGILTEQDYDAVNKKWLVPVAVGQRIGNIKYQDVNGGYTSGGLPDEKPDGIIDSKDLTLCGSNNPDFLYGISNTVSYKGFDFSFLLQGQQGGKIFFFGARAMDNGSTNNNQYSHWIHAWKPAYSDDAHNPIPIVNGQRADMSWDGKTPSPIGNNYPGGGWSDTWLYDASFLRLRNISIGYNFQPQLLRKYGISKMKVYIMGDNVRTFTKYPGATPEGNNVDGQQTGNLTTMPGIDYGNYPLSRRYNLGIDFTF